MTAHGARWSLDPEPVRARAAEALNSTARGAEYTAGAAGGALMAWPLLCGLVLAQGLTVLLVGFPLRKRIGAVLGKTVEADLRRASRYLGGNAESAPQAASRSGPEFWAGVRWACANAITGLGSGILTLVLAIGAAVSFTCPFWWWLLPAELAVTPGGYPVDSWPAALATPLVGFGYLALAALLVPRTARGHASLARRMLLHPGKSGLLSRVTEVVASRQEALEAHGAELRRIERDLHDGTQSRMVAVHMHLGIIERLLADDPRRARELIAVAKEAAEDALSDLRSVVRSIHPPILADRGLPSAVESLAARSALPCTVEIGELPRLPAAMEAAAYFAVTESLANAGKHAEASDVRIRICAEEGMLLIAVTDDGRGGADEDSGSGLAGIRRRVAAFDGRTRITSPDGGPTTIEIRMPCVF